MCRDPLKLEFKVAWADYLPNQVEFSDSKVKEIIQLITNFLGLRD